MRVTVTGAVDATRRCAAGLDDQQKRHSAGPLESCVYKRFEMAARRNREHVAEGRAVLKTAALEKADFGGARFDKVFAFNVAPFWRQPREALGIVRRHLAPGGAVYLFWDARHTQPGRARDLADRLSERIRLAEFSVNQVLVKDLRPVPAVCVIGRP